MRFQLHIIPICPNLPWDPSDLNALGPAVEDIFWTASGTRIELGMTYEDPVYPTNYTVVTKWHLEAALAKYAHNQAGVVHDLGLIIGPQWDHRRDIYGIMFDADLPYTHEVGTSLDVNSNNINREGAAIFVQALKDAGFNHPRYTARTVVHELGHIFNLPHDLTGESFMTTTTDSLRPSAFADFKPGEQMFLTECERSTYVQPGGSSFGDRGELAYLVT